MVTMPEVHRVGGLAGAELRGLDLTKVYEDETYAAIARAWAENGVIFFRDQHLNAEQRDAFAARLDRDVGQPADMALRGQRLPGPAPRDAPHPAGGQQADPGGLASAGNRLSRTE
jgi:alpha-ketoglutarate-dependent taurine dioxygenase